MKSQPGEQDKKDGNGLGDLDADTLLPLVYEELRKLANSKMANETPGQTLQSTALVHEAYLRLMKQNGVSKWDNKGHFFAAAAESMRRILVEKAREKKRLKRGGERKRLELHESDPNLGKVDENVLLIDEALEELAKEDPIASEVMKLRYYTGLSVEQAAKALNISRANAYRHWNYARAWVTAAIGNLEND